MSIAACSCQCCQRNKASNSLIGGFNHDNFSELQATKDKLRERGEEIETLTKQNEDSEKYWCRVANDKVDIATLAVNHLEDKLKACEAERDTNHNVNLIMNEELKKTEDKLKACEAERERTVNGYAEEQLKLLGRITELEAERDDSVKLSGLRKDICSRLTREKLEVTVKLHALEKIAREGLYDCPPLLRRGPLKKIDDLDSKN